MQMFVFIKLKHEQMWAWIFSSISLEILHVENIKGWGVDGGREGGGPSDTLKFVSTAPSTWSAQGQITGGTGYLSVNRFKALDILCIYHI